MLGRLRLGAHSSFAGGESGSRQSSRERAFSVWVPGKTVQTRVVAGSTERSDGCQRPSKEFAVTRNWIHLRRQEGKQPPVS